MVILLVPSRTSGLGEKEIMVAGALGWHSSGKSDYSGLESAKATSPQQEVICQGTRDGQVLKTIREVRAGLRSGMSRTHCGAAAVYW